MHLELIQALSFPIQDDLLDAGDAEKVGKQPGVILFR